MSHLFASLRNTLLVILLGLGLPMPGRADKGPRLPPIPDSLRQVQQAATTPKARAELLLRVAEAYYEPFDSAGVVLYTEAAERAARRLGDHSLEGRAIDRRGEYYRQSGNLRQAAPLLQRADQHLAAGPDRHAYANALYHRGMLYGDLNRREEAHRYFRRALHLFRQVGDDAEAAQVLNSIGLLYTNEQQTDSATWYLLRAVREHRRLGRRLPEAAALGNVALVYYSLGRYPEAARYLRQGYAIEAAEGDTVALATSIANLGALALARDSLRQSLGYLRQGLLLKQRKKMVGEYWSSLVHIGECYKRLHLPDSAYYYLRQAMANATRYGRTTDQALTMLKLAQAYQQDRRFAEAEQLAQQVMRLGNLNPQHQLEPLRVLRRVAEQRGDYPRAYALLQREQALQQQQQEKDSEALTEELRVGYETEQAEQKVALLEKNQELNRLSRQRELGWIAALVLASLLVGGGLLWAYRRRQRRREAALRHQLAADLHDDVGTLLSQIALQTDLLQEGLGAPESQHLYWAEVAGNSRLAVRQLNDVVWNLDAHNDTVPDLLNRLRDYAHEVLVPSGRDVQFHADESAATAPPLPAAVRRHLYLIFKEALHNILKYAPTSATVTVALRVGRHGLVLDVVNSGAVLFTAGRISGHGLRNIQTRAQALGGSATAGPRPEGGFAVRVQVPLR